MLTMMKQPSAFMPIVMSPAAFALVLVHIAIFGAVREADEGTAAHIFHLLIVAQVPIVGFFAIKWLPVMPKQAMLILAMQVGGIILAFMPVYIFNL
jgi:hypothetical protein